MRWPIVTLAAGLTLASVSCVTKKIEVQNGISSFKVELLQSSSL